MKQPQNEQKKAICVVLDAKYIAQLEELREVLVRPSVTDVVRFLIIDGAKKFLPENCPNGQK